MIQPMIRAIKSSLVSIAVTILATIITVSVLGYMIGEYRSHTYKMKFDTAKQISFLLSKKNDSLTQVISSLTMGN